jgi:ABC-type branched-subunit amino acid transport system substrate-binding protein/predicted negative regulator of RcsB-dependent stress response
MIKLKLRLLLPIIAFAICSCSAAQLNTRPSPEPDSAIRLFSLAENLFQANSIENALKAYQEFFACYPSNSKADIALIRIASIYSKQEKFADSLVAYRTLIAEYPDSPLATDAMVEILMLLFKKDQFKDVILLASKIIEKTDSKTHLSRTYEVLGDTYMSLKSPKEAIFFYRMAGLAKEENISLKLRTATNQLSEQDLFSLSTILDDQFLTGYFLFERGLYQVHNENYKAALNIFSELTTNFPDHEKTHAAQQWIEEINKRLVFKRQVIGCLLPLSGPYAEFGNRALKGIQFALDQFNCQSNKPAFKIIIEDTHSDPETAITAVKQFDENRVSSILGPIITSEYAAQEAQSLGIPIITLTQKQGIPELGDFVFRIFLTPQMQIDTLLPYVINELDIKHFAVLYPEEVYGNTFLKYFRERVLDYGGTLVAVESYKPDQTDFASQIKKLTKSWERHEDGYPALRKQQLNRKTRHKKYEVVLDFDAIFIPDNADKIALIAPQLTFFDIDNVLLLGTNLWHSDKLIHLAHDYVQEAIIADAFYAEDSNIKVQEFIRSFKELYGQSPGFIEAIAYDTAMINFFALSNLEIQSRDDLKEALQNLTDFNGVTGYTSFKENGESNKQLYLLQIENNQFVQLNRN